MKISFFFLVLLFSKYSWSCPTLLKAQTYKNCKIEYTGNENIETDQVEVPRTIKISSSKLPSGVTVYDTEASFSNSRFEKNVYNMAVKEQMTTEGKITNSCVDDKSFQNLRVLYFQNDEFEQVELARLTTRFYVTNKKLEISVTSETTAHAEGNFTETTTCTRN